jgi:hypothetical protein
MTDYTSDGAVPADVDDADELPTVDEVRERQRIEHPDQYETARQAPPQDALLEGDNGGA